MVAKEIKIIKEGDKYRTSGFRGYIGREVAVNLPIDEEIVRHLVDEIYKKVKKDGKMIADGSEDRDILSCKIFYKYKDDYVVVVFPDKKLRYPWDGQCEAEYKEQI